MNTLAKHHPRPVILLDRYDAVMFYRGDVNIGLSRGERSFYLATGRSGLQRVEGLEWPLDGLAMRPGPDRYSNRVAAADGGHINAAEGSGYLIMLESRSMMALVEHRPTML